MSRLFCVHVDGNNTKIQFFLILNTMLNIDILYFIITYILVYFYVFRQFIEIYFHAYYVRIQYFCSCIFAVFTVGNTSLVVHAH